MWTNSHLAGLLPDIITASDPRPAAEQIAERYAHGGGYRPFGGGSWALGVKGGKITLEYPGGPMFREVARIELAKQTVVLFDSAFVAIIELDLAFVVLRMD
jgi:hypothetical protein